MSITIRNVIKYLRGNKSALKKKDVKKFIISDGFIAFMLTIVSFVIGFFIQKKHLDTITKHPAYTVGIVLEKKYGPQSAKYVRYKYKVGETTMIREQPIGIFICPKLIQDVKKGEKYLVVYNLDKNDMAFIVNIKVKGKLGDKLKGFSAKKLRKEGFIKKC